MIFYKSSKKKDSIIDIESVIKLQEKQSYFNSILDLEAGCILGTIINNDNDYIYKDFTVRFLTNDEEEKIIKYWFII